MTGYQIEAMLFTGQDQGYLVEHDEYGTGISQEPQIFDTVDDADRLINRAYSSPSYDYYQFNVRSL